MSNSVAAAPAVHTLTAPDFDHVWATATAWIGDNAVRILIAAGIAAAIVVSLSAIRSLGVSLCRRDRLGTGWPGIVGGVIAKTKFWFIVLLAIDLVAGYADPPQMFWSLIKTLFTIAASLQAALWLREFVLRMIDHRAGAGLDTDHRTLGSAMGLIRLLVTVVLFAIAIVLILDNLGVNVTGLVAGLGIGGIAIGLAAQGIFSDLFAALSIIFDKPFRVGDTVKWDQTAGVVERIGLKTTRIRANTGEMVVVANAKLLEKELHNETHFEHRRFTMTLGVTYETPLDRLEAIPKHVAGIVESHPECTMIRCALANFNTSSLDFELLFDVRAAPPADPFQIRSDIYLAILRTFAEEGVAFAYPVQVGFTAAPDGRLILPYPAEATRQA